MNTLSSVVIGASAAAVVCLSLNRHLKPNCAHVGVLSADFAQRTIADESGRAIPRPRKLFGQQDEDCSEVALVDVQLKQIVKSGAFHFQTTNDLSPYVQPASIDIPVGGKIFLVKEKLLPFNQRVSDLIEALTLEEKILDEKGVVLLKGQTYLVHIGAVELPLGARGCLSPKSSIGRVDVMVRGIVDGCGLYDIIPAGGQEHNVQSTDSRQPTQPRQLWLEISPRSFNVRLKAGVTLTQLMVFMPWDKAENLFPSANSRGGDETSEIHDDSMPAIADVVSNDALTSPRTSPALRSLEVTDRGTKRPNLLDLREERICFDENGRILPVKLHRGAVVLSVAVPSGGKLAGYEALSTEEVIDLAALHVHDPSLFFRPLPASRHGLSSASGSGGARLTLEKDRFYILATKERVSVPLHLSAEMVPFSHHVGELRAHYAGFFDPGFGYGRKGETHGTVGVLEVRPHETINIYDGQPICLMDFFANAALPEKPYGFSGSNYHQQSGPCLAKYFQSFPSH